MPSHKRHGSHRGGCGHQPPPQPDVAAASAVTPVGSAARHVGLPAERHTTGAAVTAAHIALGDVDESGHALRIRSGPAGSCDYPGADDFRGDGFAPHTVCSLPRLARNAANDVIVAEIVSRFFIPL